MTSVLGLPLERAEAILSAAGVVVTCEEISCRKGRAGESMRVLAQRPRADGSVHLLYAGFQTSVSGQE